MSNYRQYFKSYYKIHFSRDYDIHHIDGNHQNNEIDNLMILPKELHKKYHELLPQAEGARKNINFVICGYGASYNTYARDILSDFLEVLKECAVWYDYKLFLDGKLQNIHEISLSDREG